MYWKTAPDLDCKHLHNYNSVAKWMNGVIFTARSKPMPQRPNGGGGLEWVVESMTVTHSSADLCDILLPVA